MARTKHIVPEYILKLDRPPQRERIFEKFRKSFEDVATFYRFEMASTPVVDDSKAYADLLKSGFLELRPPIACKTRAGDDIFLRPSVILSLLRSYLPQKMQDLPHPLKFFSEGEGFFMSRGRDKEIRGRFEWSLLIIGEEGPVAEAEILQIIWKALEKIEGLDKESLGLRVNAATCNECRSHFRSAFNVHFRSRVGKLCKNCRKHLKRSPERLLQCMEEKCKIVASNAPQVLDFICELCKKHLRGFLEFLDEVKIPYFLDPKFFIDGLWYSRLVFEVALTLAKEAGQNNSSSDDASEKERLVLAEGGRMSRAAELMVKRPVEAAGALVWFDTLEAYFLKKGIALDGKGKTELQVFLAHLGELAKRKSLALLETLRAENIAVGESLDRDSIKSQLKIAEKIGAEITLIMGQKEALDNTIIVRETFSGIQETIPQEKLIEFLKRKLKKKF